MDRLVPALPLPPGLAALQIRPLGLRQRPRARPREGPELQTAQVNPQHRLRVLQCHERRDRGPEISSVRAVALVPESAHEPVPQPRRVSARDSRSGGPFRKSVAGQRGDDQVERRPGDAVGVRVSEKRHQGEQLHERAGPAVREDERRRPIAGRPGVDEMDADTIQLGAKVVEPAQPALFRTPVELVGPVP